MLKKVARKISHKLGDKLMTIADILEEHEEHHEDGSDIYAFEKNSWGDCCNTFGEDIKHYTYAKYLGLHRDASYSFAAPAPKILDIGGGPSSILLKTRGLKEGVVVDPIDYPAWTISRYNARNIEYVQMPGEDYQASGFDEAWIYNCLQHALDPQKIINNALKSAKVLRIFEWVDIPAHEGHPHHLTEVTLNQWIGAKGRVIDLKERFCRGKAYYGVFRSPY